VRPGVLDWRELPVGTAQLSFSHRQNARANVDRRCGRNIQRVRRFCAAQFERRSMAIASPEALRRTRVALEHVSGAIPAIGFGTLLQGDFDIVMLFAFAETDQMRHRRFP
jgi:hypothetical protein